MSVCKDVTIGKILIQTNEATGEPEVNIANIINYLHSHTDRRYIPPMYILAQDNYA